MKFNKTAVPLFLIAALLSGCTADEEKNDFLDDTSAKTVDTGVATDTYNEEGAKVSELNVDRTTLSGVEALMNSPEFSDSASLLSKRTIYFEYDSSQVLSEFFPVIEAHAQYLMNHPNQRIVLEGHSDERGTREYNIALAEQRAKSVFKMLQLIGVMSNQVDIVSYGEEKPVAMAHNDKSYALNRRVQLVYK
ncbi:MAG: peptidoglycan-associated lipoprotein Pal [Methyloprofundus sp.]|nr:peptidoglycan-associated lipoprotein Pal [Methyloprofundus sp.]